MQKSLAARRRQPVAAPLDHVDSDGVFSGYASLFDVPDLSRDVVAPGAFAKTLAKRGAAGIKLLYQHNPAEPIGSWLTVREDHRGLFVRGKLMTDVARARETLSLMRAGILDGLSIGFRTVRGRTERKSGIRRLLEVDLWEISVVTFPMLPNARVASVKDTGWIRSNADGRPDPVGSEDIELARVIRSAARTMKLRGRYEYL